MKVHKYLFLSFLLFFSCVDYYPCDSNHTGALVISSDDIHVNFVHEWKKISDNQHKIVFRFGQRELPDGSMLSYRFDDVCTYKSFISKLIIHSNLDYTEIETPFGARIDYYKIMIWYPSVPPSQKIFMSEGNRNNKHDISIRLPRPANGDEFATSWVDVGLEVQYKTEIGNGFTEDLEMIKKELDDFTFYPDYFEF